MDFSYVLYLTKDNRSTNIYYINNKTININKLINQVLDDFCYPSLSTFEGRIKSIKHIYNINTYIPVYISEDIILQPLYPKKSWQQIYVNVPLIKDTIKNNNNTIIKFIDDSFLNVDISYTKMNKLISQCHLIKNNQIRKKGII